MALISDFETSIMHLWRPRRDVGRTIVSFVRPLAVVSGEAGV